MPTSSLPRLPARKKTGTNSLIVVGSGFSIKRPVIVDTAIRIDQTPCRGALMFSLHARISMVAYTLLGNAPPRLSDTPRPILGSSERSPLVYSPKGKGVMG